MSNLTVNLADRSYEIIVEDNLLTESGNLIKNVIPINKVFIVADTNTAKLYLDSLIDTLDEAGIDSSHYILPAGESTKSLDNLEVLINKIFETTPERKSTLIALGGGVIGDITGFAASIILRGINFIQIPTTLLAQVDSSVGGKTGINNNFGKNLIGSFYQPKLVISDISTLKTLSDREFLSGYAEVVKYALIGDREFFDWLNKHHQEIKDRDSSILKEAVIKSCKMKADIVSQDEREGGVRALLNLGHTFGHALELKTGYSNQLLHGEAVAIGMVMAFSLSAEIGICQEEELNSIIEHFKKIGLPYDLSSIEQDLDAKELLKYMMQDKKVSQGKLVLILANSIGDAFIKKDVDSNLVLDTLKRFINN